MSIDQNKQLVRAYYENVVGMGDVDRVAEFVSPDYVEVYRGVRHAIGLEGARAHVAGVRAALEGLSITVDQQIGEGEWVVSCVTVRGTNSRDWLGMRATGREMEFTGVNVDRVVDGLIVEHGGAANLYETLLECGAVRIVDPVAD